MQLRMERTLQLVHHRLVRVVIQGQHAPEGSHWAALPVEYRSMTVATKQLVLREVGRKTLAKIAQSHMNIAARQQPAASMSEFGICLDRSFVPELRRFSDYSATRNAQRGRKGNSQPLTSLHVACCDSAEHAYTTARQILLHPEEAPGQRGS